MVTAIRLLSVLTVRLVRLRKLVKKFQIPFSAVTPQLELTTNGCTVRKLITVLTGS